MNLAHPVLRLALGLTAALAVGRAAARAQPIDGTASPIDLPTALRLAGARNLDVQLARASVKEAKANRQSALEQFLPWLRPGLAYHRHDGLAQAVPAGTVSDADYQSYAPGATIGAQIDLGDAIYHALAARQLVKAARHALAAQRQDAILAAAQGYFHLAKAKAVVEVVWDALRISKGYQEQLHEAVAAGIAFKGDELRVQTQTEGYRLAIGQAIEQQRLEAARLARLLHLDASVELVPQPADLIPLSLPEANRTLTDLVAQALRTRPERKQGDALVAAAREEKNGALYGPWVPSVGAQLFGGGLGGGPDHGPGNFGSTADFVAGVSWRVGPSGLFDSGRRHDREARLAAARLAVEKLHDAIVDEVVESYTRVRSAREQLATAARNLAAADQTLRLTRQRKEFGVGIVLENIQAQQELARARENYIAVVAEYDEAQYALRRAVGGSR